MLHLIVPGVVAWFGFAPRWQRAWLIMLLTLLIDTDHLLATPVFDPHRCSIGFHPLHSWWAIAMYVGLTALPQTRLVGSGLVIHMALDSIDCVMILGS
jgi:hypothetical protein